MRSHGIEPDASNFPIGPYSVDFWFEAERVVVEFDSRRYHNNSKRFVTDRRRNPGGKAAGEVTRPRRNSSDYQVDFLPQYCHQQY